MSTPAEIGLKVARTGLIVLGCGWILLVLGCATFQRKLLYYPGHEAGTNGLTPWIDHGQVIGYSQKALEPHVVWLICHGNAGQAVNRTYALGHFLPADSIYILEYPGYGQRAGEPSEASFDEAAASAYQLLRRTFPSTPICVFGESIGSGPSCALASQSKPPDKIVLVVPFDRLLDVASDHYPFLPVSLILKDRWDNIAALRAYRGPVEIYGAAEDAVIPVRHARALADSVPQTKWTLLQGGHNDWSAQRFDVRYP